MRNGDVAIARDYVIIYKMKRAPGLQPAANAELHEISKVFSWNPVPSAKYYQVLINDFWSSQSVVSSELLTTTNYTPPINLLKHEGAFCWRVHAGNVNEVVLLGDFNHSLLTKCYEFDIN